MVRFIEIQNLALTALSGPVTGSSTHSKAEPVQEGSFSCYVEDAGEARASPF